MGIPEQKNQKKQTPQQTQGKEKDGQKADVPNQNKPIRSPSKVDDEWASFGPDGMRSKIGRDQ